MPAIWTLLLDFICKCGWKKKLLSIEFIGTSHNSVMLKLYFQSTIKTQVNVLLYLFLGRLGRQGAIENFDNFDKLL